MINTSINFAWLHMFKSNILQIIQKVFPGSIFLWNMDHLGLKTKSNNRKTLSYILGLFDRIIVVPFMYGSCLVGNKVTKSNCRDIFWPLQQKHLYSIFLLNFVSIFALMISRPLSKMGHIRLKTRSHDHVIEKTC